MTQSNVPSLDSTTNFATNCNENISEFSPRYFQMEIAALAEFENLIICLPTGSGKTFIVFLVIRSLSPITRQKLCNGGKRTILLVNNVELAKQHHETLKNSLDMKIEICVGGSSKNNLSNSKGWQDRFEINNLLIFTAEIFLKLLDHGLFSLDKVNLLIFDECHHAGGNNTYARIMKSHYLSCSTRPRILGLTASVSAQRLDPMDLSKAARELELIYDARIETGSNYRMEINANSTSVKTEYHHCQNYQDICKKNKHVRNIFQNLEMFLKEVEQCSEVNYDENQCESKQLQHQNNTNSIELQCRNFGQLKSHLNNIIQIGYELGLRGFCLGIEALLKTLERKLKRTRTNDLTGKSSYQKIIEKLKETMNNEYIQSDECQKYLYSDKVIKLEHDLRTNTHGQCIVFVERVYTTVFLHRVLQEKCNNSIRTEYIASSKPSIDGICVSKTHKREVMQKFRHKEVNVLIATAIVEEGLDIPECNLVIRFNRPNNFSSYLQSKGRARAAENHARFLIFHDESNCEEYSRNKIEYRSYEYIEKMLRGNFQLDDADEHGSPNDDFDSIQVYQPSNSIKIDGIRATQIIFQYCAIIAIREIVPPRFCIYKQDNKKYKCVLSMPANCPIRDRITCENHSKRLAQQECCIKMVEILHRKSLLSENCAPIRRQKYPTLDNSDDDNDKKMPPEIIEKQSSYLFHDYDNQSTHWHLYQIDISNSDGHDLGFLVPCRLPGLPTFNLYGCMNVSTVNIIYLKPVEIHQYMEQLKKFNRYIFEEVFLYMNTGDGSNLKYDMENSTFKLFICFLQKSGEIDVQTMTLTYQRKDLLIEDLNELKDDELYCVLHLPKHQHYIYVPDPSLAKSLTDQWEHKQSSEAIQCYADHFEQKQPSIRIKRDRLMATMRCRKRPRINYLKDCRKRQKESNSQIPEEPLYFPVEFLRYAVLNQKDFELISQLPSILVRILQLYYVEHLRTLLLTAIQACPSIDIPHESTVTFSDCLIKAFSSVKYKEKDNTSSDALPLTSMNYNLFFENVMNIDIPPGFIFQSITRHSTDEQTDMENLEVLGDCFLKFALSMSLYHKYPDDDAGDLTSKKDAQVSNKYLHQLANQKHLMNYLYADKVIFGSSDANWIPPGYKINEAIEDDENKMQKYIKQKVKRKAFADMIEALIGTFLIATNYMTTLKFMNWLGLEVIPVNEQNTIMKPPSILISNSSSSIDATATNEIEKFYRDFGFYEVEQKLNYTFHEKEYLIAAFTCPSYYDNRLTQCYEKLEYLGDAVLDFLVVRYIFVTNYEKLTPARVTDIRQDISNNGRLAKLLISCDLHKKILHASPALFSLLKAYREESKDSCNTKPSDDLSNEDIDEWIDPKAPKVLADVFEALIGAIFLDSEYSLETVWKVIEPMLKKDIDRSIENPNINPVRLFQEKGGKILDCSEINEGTEFTCFVKLDDKEFRGYGFSKRMAKTDACRQAIKSIEH